MNQNVQSAWRRVTYLKRGAVRGGDRPHDGQPEANAVALRRPLGEPLERLKQPGERLIWHHLAGVEHAQERTAVIRPGADLKPAIRLVVPDRVVNEVPHHPVQQLLAGAVLGGFATAVFATTRHWHAVVPAGYLAAAVGVALAVGAAAGVYPAVRAARLSPAEALRLS